MNDTKDRGDFPAGKACKPLAGWGSLDGLQVWKPATQAPASLKLDGSLGEVIRKLISGNYSSATSFN